MALFGMVWLLRVRAEMKRCAKCRRQEMLAAAQATSDERAASQSTFFTIDASLPPLDAELASGSGQHAHGPTTYCEVHGFNPPKEGNNWILTTKPQPQWKVGFMFKCLLLSILLL